MAIRHTEKAFTRRFVLDDSETSHTSNPVKDEAMVDAQAEYIRPVVYPSHGVHAVYTMMEYTFYRLYIHLGVGSSHCSFNWIGQCEGL